MPSNLYIGTCGWSYDDWCGPFYPEFTNRDQFLQLYSECFNGVEVESTAHKLPGKEAFRRWRSRTPDDFKFALAAPWSITRGDALRKAGEGHDLAEFLAQAEELGGNLGPILFSFPYRFGLDNMPDMTSFVRSLPSGFAFVVEMRHRDWINEMFIDHLREKKVALAYSNLPWMAGALKVKTAETAYIRFRGGKNHKWDDYSKTRVDETEAMRKLANEAAVFVKDHRPVFCFFSNDFEGHGPASASGFQNMMARRFA